MFHQLLNAPVSRRQASTLTPEQIAVLPHDNAGTRLNVVVWILTTAAGLFLGLRLYCKLFRGKKLWWDDWFLIASWVVILAATILVSYCVQLGFGAHIWDFPMQNFSKFVKIFSVSGFLTIIASMWSKTSFALTILRLTDGWARSFIWFLIASLNLFMGLTAIFAWVHCGPIEKLFDPTLPGGYCWPLEPLQSYNMFAGVWSGVIDITLAIFPWYLLRNLQMRTVEKLGVIACMSMGVFAGVTSFVKTSYLPKLGSGDSYDMVSLSCWVFAESTVTIIAASIPALRALLKEVSNKSSGSSGQSGGLEENSLGTDGKQGSAMRSPSEATWTSADIKDSTSSIQHVKG